MKVSNIKRADLDDELVMSVTAPSSSYADMRSSESNAFQEGAHVQQYCADAIVAVTPPEGFTTQVIPNMCCR